MKISQLTCEQLATMLQIRCSYTTSPLHTHMQIQVPVCESRWLQWIVKIMKSTFIKWNIRHESRKRACSLCFHTLSAIAAGAAMLRTKCFIYEIHCFIRASCSSAWFLMSDGFPDGCRPLL